MGLTDLLARCGGAKRSAGEIANGIPKNLFTKVLASGRLYVSPTTKPESVKAVGSRGSRAKAEDSNRPKVATVKKIKDILMLASS